MYLSTQRLSFCQSALYIWELIISIDHAFSFGLLCFVKQIPLNSSNAFILTVLGCCLELGAMPVRYKCGGTSRPVRLYIPLICVSLRAHSFLTYIL